MKKLCLVNPTVLIKRPVLEIISQNKDVEVGLLCPKKLFSRFDKNKYHSTIPNAKVYTYSTVTLPFIASEWPIPVTPMFFIQLFRIFIRYDVIQMWTYFYISSFFIFITKIFFPKKKLILTMDTIPGYSFSMGNIMDKCFHIYSFIFNPLFRTADVITLYGSSLKKFASDAGFNKKKIVVIPTGVDINKFDDSKADIRKEFNIKLDTVVVLFVGLLVPRKGIDIILKVAEKNKALDACFILVGDGPNRPFYESEIDKRNLKNVIVPGWRRDIGRFFKSSDIFFLPSRGEGLAGVIMEAMSCSLPVVSSNIPCTTDLVIDKKTGYLCDIEDVDDYSEKLRKLILNKKMRINMGKAGHEKIKEFSWESALEKYKRIY